MSFRTVLVDSRCKLEYSLNYLICTKQYEQKKILLDEIKTIIISSTQVVISTALIVMLSTRKIKVIFCDSTHNPECELIPYANNFYSYRKIKEQIEFVKEAGFLWKEIIKEKIKTQANNLKIIGDLESYRLLNSYIYEVKDDDVSKREGHAAKVYFNRVFGNGFTRDGDILINKYLNYGYAILVSQINREIKSLGYLTELGIHHIGESNSFNFTYDLVEPLRALVDLYVIKNLVNESNFKIVYARMLSLEVTYSGKVMHLDNAIHYYVNDMINYLKYNDENYLNFIEYEF